MTMSKTSKRVRAANFNKNEINLLIDICVKFSNVIENKQTDAVNWKEKNEAWDKISVQFNSQTEGVHRDSKTLRLKYDCIKRDIKTKKSKNKLETYLTGGGKPDIQAFTDYEEKVLQVISMSVEGLPYHNDCDRDVEMPLPLDDSHPVLSSSTNVVLEEYVIDNGALIPVNQENNEKQSENKTINIEKPTNNTENSSTVKLNSSNWANPQNKKRKQFLNQEKQGLGLKYNVIAKDRENLIKIQTENAMKEKEYLDKKIRYLDEEHELKMKKIRLEIREKEVDLLKKGSDLIN